VGISVGGAHRYTHPHATLRWCSQTFWGKQTGPRMVRLERCLMDLKERSYPCPPDVPVKTPHSSGVSVATQGL
jgi:hypothetical protein